MCFQDLRRTTSLMVVRGIRNRLAISWLDRPRMVLMDRMTQTFQGSMVAAPFFSPSRECECVKLMIS
jgi:hypothetical protein